MKTFYLCRYGLVILLFLAIWSVGQAQDSLGMRCLSGLNYWQGVNNIQMVGDLAYIMAGTSGLHIMDLSDPADPVEIGRYTWFQYVAGGEVYVLGNRAYLGLAAGGFVLDVSDPTDPVVLGQWNSSIGSCISFVQGDYAVAHMTGGYPYVLDVSDPTNVHHIGDFPYGEAREGVGMAGEYLCMTGWYPGGLILYDMSNPANPQRVASIDTAFNTYRATISGNYAYLATQHNGLRIIDLSNPLQPVEVAACDSGGWTYDVTVTGSHAVVLKGTSSDAWLNIWNVADPAHPLFEGMMPTQTFGWFRVASSGNLVCSAMGSPYYAIMVVDISNPTAPVEVSSFGPKGTLTRTVISGTTAYLADRTTGLRTVDFTDPYHLSELTHMNTLDERGLDVAVRGNYAYVMESFIGGSTDSLVVFDVSNPAQPESLGCVFAEDGKQIVIAGDYAYVTGIFDLYSFSLANPAVPQCVDVLDLPAAAPQFGLAELNGYLYYGAWSTFYVYSLSNPSAPQLVGSCSLSGSGCVFDLAAADRYVYVADGYGDMRIVDVGDPANPSEVNWIGGNWVGSVAAVENIVIIDDRTRISIYDVTDPLNPILAGYYSTYEHITDMEIQGQYLFTTSISEFRVYQCDALTNVIAPSEPIPTEFNLLPPYPNPFNSTLVIPFTIPVQSTVNISIYNILGQRVDQFDFPPLSPGAHRILWDANSLASGVYIVNMLADGKELRQKVVLLK